MDIDWCHLQNGFNKEFQMRTGSSRGVDCVHRLKLKKAAHICGGEHDCLHNMEGTFNPLDLLAKSPLTFTPTALWFDVSASSTVV